jgi:hypothetical protein
MNSGKCGSLRAVIVECIIARIPHPAENVGKMKEWRPTLKLELRTRRVVVF